MNQKKLVITMKTWRTRFPTIVLLLLLFLQLATSGPGPSPLNFGTGKLWSKWGSEEVRLATDQLNVTTAEGHTASLPCRVLHLNDKRVSWIRKSDLAVLAIDRMTVTTDQRFSVIHPEETGDWILEIRAAAVHDTGAYDCQVNTYPKKSTRVNLKVLSPEDADAYLQMPASDGLGVRRYEEAVRPKPNNRRGGQSPTPNEATGKAISLFLHGRGWAEVHSGKALALTCEAEGDKLREVHSSSKSQESPLIEWTLDEVPVTALFDREKLEVYESWEDNSRVVSQLTLFDLTVEDSGTFGCHAPHTATQSMPVTVLPYGSLSTHEGSEKMKNHGTHYPGDTWPRKHAGVGPIHSDRPLRDKPLRDEYAPSRASSCSGHKNIIISGAVMIVIMLINVAIGVAMYCKTH